MSHIISHLFIHSTSRTARQRRHGASSMWDKEGRYCKLMLKWRRNKTSLRTSELSVRLPPSVSLLQIMRLELCCNIRRLKTWFLNSPFKSTHHLSCQGSSYLHRSLSGKALLRRSLPGKALLHNNVHSRPISFNRYRRSLALFTIENSRSRRLKVCASSTRRFSHRASPRFWSLMQYRTIAPLLSPNRPVR